MSEWGGEADEEETATCHFLLGCGSFCEKRGTDLDGIR